MPVLPNSGAEIFLITPGNELCDASMYSPDYHHEILAGTKGVSLERISAGKPGSSPANWHSASSDAGYMTPGAANSQTGSEEDCFIRVSPGTLILNENGTNDRLTIDYQLDKEGYMAQILIFDLKGKRKYTVAEGVLLGTEGKFEIEDSALREAQLSTGYYIIFFNAYHEDGNNYSEKVSFVVVR